MSQAQLNELGRLLLRERSKANLTQRELAKKAGVVNATIWHLERGDFKRPDPDKLLRIVHALDLNAADCFALVGYLQADQLPSLGRYLRTKFKDELSARDRNDIESYIERRRAERRSEKKARVG